MATFEPLCTEHGEPYGQRASREGHLRVPSSSASGVIIDMFGMAYTGGCEMPRHIIDAFKCNVVLVLSDERMSHFLRVGL